MSHAYAEDQLAEQSAIGLFAELGYEIGHAPRQLSQGAFTRTLV